MENHNMSKSRIYSVWRAMKKRCYREKDQEYKAYGSRGIQVCDEWKNSFVSFYNWSIENGYTEETMTNNRNRLTLDRINNNGNYEPSNCRWVTRDEQDKNRANNFIVEFKGKQYTISELSEMCDIDRTTLYERVAFLGWNIEDAMTRPIRKIKGKKKEFMDKYYLIRDRKSGCYLVKGREWTKDIELATRYKSKKLAERSTSNSYLMVSMDCEVVELPSRAEIFADLEAKLADIQQEQIKEMQEHQEAMELADKTITSLVEDNRASQEWYKKQLADKDKAIENWQTMYESVMQTCHNDKEEIERLNKQLSESESRFQAHKQNDARIIQDQTDLIENLRQQLADTEEQNKRVLEKLELIVRANQELEQKLAEKEELKLRIKKLEKLYSEALETVDSMFTNQDKISFAVEQLEQLKHDIWTDQQDDGWLDEQVDIYFLNETIDNQIKQLTHQHEDKGE